MNVNQFYPLYLKAQNVVIDSRKVKKGDLFFAFSGDKYNAAEFSQQAIENGALAVIVEQEQFENIEKNIYFVPSTLAFLQDLAKYHRAQLQIPIIGLTGSNGKTTTKELIHAVLQKKFDTQYTHGNLNNHIGVPLTILSIKKQHQMAVVEMGANHQKEIELLSSIAQPTIGYITNFGKAHLEGFGGVEGVIKGKSELYQFLIAHQQTVLVNQKDPIQLDKTQNYQPTISFGLPTSDYYFEAFSKNNFVGLNYQKINIQSHLTGDYNFNNLSAAVSLGLHFGIEISEIKAAIEDYQPTNMRSQVIEKEGKTFVLDTYNANPSSMAESLKNFNHFEGTKTIIIGDMFELGEESKHEHQEIMKLVEALDFDEVITVGPFFKEVNHSYPAFSKVEELIEKLKLQKPSSKNILLKASRGIALERIFEYL